MIYLKTDDEIELLRKANLLVSATLTEIAKVVAPGVTTRQLDTLAEQFIRDNGAEPTFKGFPNPYGSPFPASICASVNEVVVHGIPNDEPLKDGLITPCTPVSVFGQMIPPDKSAFIFVMNFASPATSIVARKNPCG